MHTSVPPPSPRHIVVVADDADLRDVLASVVGELGHRATAWASCASPERLEEVRADALVIDLPFENHGAAGLALVQAVRSGDRTRDLPVVASIDAIDGGVDPEMLLAYRGVVVVVKPFGIEEFERALQRAIHAFSITG